MGADPQTLCAARGVIESGWVSVLALGSTPATPDLIGTPRGSLRVLHEGVKNCDRGGRDPQGWLSHFQSGPLEATEQIADCIASGAWPVFDAHCYPTPIRRNHEDFALPTVDCIRRRVPREFRSRDGR